MLIKINDLSSTDYYITFNHQSIINSGTQEYGNQVAATYQGAKGTSYAELELVAKLGAGGATWSGVVGGKMLKHQIISYGIMTS